MYLIIYGMLGDDQNGELFIDGPFFGACEPDHHNAEILTKKLGTSKTKNQIMPWIFKLKQGETVGKAMIRIKNSWFKRFKTRTLETAQTIQRDQELATCPFTNVNFNQHLENSLH